MGLDEGGDRPLAAISTTIDRITATAMIQISLAMPTAVTIAVDREHQVDDRDLRHHRGVNWPITPRAGLAFLAFQRVCEVP